ncbi:MAG: phosphate signaling complex protein PhoU [Anaerolineae bacterium]
MTRETFQGQIKSLQEELLGMGRMVDTAITRSIQALAERDVELARQILEDDKIINRTQRDIEEKSLVLIATQQPMAGDLRAIMCIVSLATELERMGDHAEGIAKITLLMADQPLLKPLIDIPRMAEISREMLRGQLEAFINQDVNSARRLAHRDEEVDDLYDQVFRELLVFMMDDPRTITRATYLLWVAHNLERIADRTTNIGERVVFMVTGNVEELNP